MSAWIHKEYSFGYKEPPVKCKDVSNAWDKMFRMAMDELHEFHREYKRCKKANSGTITMDKKHNQIMLSFPGNAYGEAYYVFYELETECTYVYPYPEVKTVEEAKPGRKVVTA